MLLQVTPANFPSTGSKLRFPDVLFLNGRGYAYRSAIDRYRADLMAEALGVPPVYPPPPDPDELVPLKQLAKEFGVCRRTVGRWMRRAPAVKAAAVAREPGEAV